MTRPRSALWNTEPIGFGSHRIGASAVKPAIWNTDGAASTPLCIPSCTHPF